MAENLPQPTPSEERDLLAHYDPLSEFNILSFISWDDETLRKLAQEWNLRGKDGLTVAEFIHVMLKVFPKPDKRNQHQRKQWAHKLFNFFIQIDCDHKNKIEWDQFLSFITACCVFDREKTRVDTVVQYHFEKEIIDHAGNFTVLKFIYDSINDHIISFNANGTVQIYSPSTLSLIKKISLHGRPIISVYDGALINERSLLAVCYPTGIQIISTMQGCSLAQDIETTDTTHFCIMYEPVSHSLFTGSENGRLHQWQAENWGEKPSHMNWRCVNSIKVTNGSAITCVTTIPNSGSFVTGDEDGQLIVWDTKNVRLIHRIQAHHAPIHTIVHSDSMHALMTAAYETTVCAWNPFIPFLISKITCPTGVVTAMTCLPDSPHLVIADRNGNLHIINSRTMQIVQTFQISPFGQFASRVNITQTTYKQLTHSLQTTGSFPVTSLCHCGPRKRFILGGRMIRFYEYEENIQPMLSDRLPIRAALHNSQFHVICTCSGCNIRHWETANGLMHCVFRKVTQSNITCMCTDCPQTLLFVATQGGELITLHFPTSSLMHNVGKQSSAITAVNHLKNINIIVTAGWANFITLWNNKNDGRLIDLLTEKKEDLLCMAVSEEYLMLAAGTGKGEINIWDLKEFKLVCVLHPQNCETEILSLTFVEHSSLLVSSDAEGYITIWSVVTDEPCAVSQLPNFYIESQTSNILSMCVVENYLLTADHCGEVRLWDISQLASQFTAPDDKKVNIERVEFLSLLNQKGKSVRYYTTQVPHINSSICVMPVGSFQLILKWKAHHSPITSISSFYANKKPIIMTSSNDCCVAVWDMRTGMCKGFLQSNPQFGLTERKWTLQYNPKEDQIITEEDLLLLLDSADNIQTPPSSPRESDI